MPVFTQGYRPYEGPRRTPVLRFLPIARTSLAVSIRWPFFAVLVVASVPLFRKLFEAYAAGAGAALFPGVPMKWGFTDGLFYELVSQEIFPAVLLLLVTGAGQIADDFRSGALQIYFSKPIRPLDYLLGKLAAVTLSALFVTLGPVLVLLTACLAFAPDFSFLRDNPLLPLRAAAFALLVSLSLGAAVLAVSSLARSGRAVGLLFGGGYFLTMVLSRVLDRLFDDARYAAVHVGKCLDAAGLAFFVEGPTPPAPIDLSFGILGSLFSVSVLVLAFRASRVEVVG